MESTSDEIVVYKKGAKYRLCRCKTEHLNKLRGYLERAAFLKLHCVGNETKEKCMQGAWKKMHIDAEKWAWEEVEKGGFLSVGDYAIVCLVMGKYTTGVLYGEKHVGQPWAYTDLVKQYKKHCRALPTGDYALGFYVFLPQERAFIKSVTNIKD